MTNQPTNQSIAGSTCASHKPLQANRSQNATQEERVRNAETLAREHAVHPPPGLKTHWTHLGDHGFHPTAGCRAQQARPSQADPLASARQGVGHLLQSDWEHPVRQSPGHTCTAPTPGAGDTYHTDSPPPPPSSLADTARKRCRMPPTLAPRGYTGLLQATATQLRICSLSDAQI